VVTFAYAGKISVGLSQAAAGVRAGSKPNILVISVCSMRKDLLKAYGLKGEPVMPAVDRFFSESAAVFENSYNGLPWISFVAFMERFFPLLLARGYLSGTPELEFPYMRIPLQKTFQEGVLTSESINNSEFEKQYKFYTDQMKEQILLQRGAPWLLIAHFKYLHYPMIDKFNPEAQWDYFLNADEKARIQEYLAHPEKYYAKLPLLLMLTSDTKYALAHPEIARTMTKRDPGSVRSLIGLVTNEARLAEWRASEGYDEDLEIFKKIYKGNARDLDKILEPILDLYGNKELQKNTVILFTGDHGEMHMERGLLTHADSGFDEGLVVPTALHFPSDWRRGFRVSEQWHMDAVAGVLDQIMAGEIHRSNLREKLGELSVGQDVFLFRDCRNSLRGVRFKNKYKYWVEAASGRRRLYDVEADPGELSDISSTRPDVADQMEALYWQNLDKFNWVRTYRCPGW
jgi:arylsulfatase A-like enzyme